MFSKSNTKRPKVHSLKSILATKVPVSVFGERVKDELIQGLNSAAPVGGSTAKKTKTKASKKSNIFYDNFY